uniref:NADH dehydrogenase subunit 6 n=1 Tax=Quadrula quadrula TaxID=52372 RepID=D2DVZ8_QUAQU|nr:NADH dehydrogenase subunit 6 [Quadrula quadrula]
MTILLYTSTMLVLLCNATLTPHPLMMSIKVLLLTISTCVMLATTTTWYAYMLFMISVGGVLVMFTYISSMSPNSIFPTKPHTVKLTMSMALTTLLLWHMITQTPAILNTQNHQHHHLENLIFFFLLDSNSGFLLFMASTLLMSMVMASTLLNKVPIAMRPTKLTNFYIKMKMQ